ncbi:MAG TPA: cyclopropane fatty acyl phospholipid synthase [Thiobacillaceae bacterium]|nr:cyclopropane fatty acyl phospholipid synthase [Thiobacillaceae bacterium]HNU64222.1 cyclopropane fatty acyl phospholipid synthase [Thiobacillaceae bacterium]
MQQLTRQDDDLLQPNTRPPAPPPVLRELAALAGLRFNGSAPWDIQVRDPAVYRQILARGSLGFGESYMDGLWDSPQLDELFHRLLRSDIDRKLVGMARVRLLMEGMRHRVLNLQSEARAFHVGERHYDIGNDVFVAMLDSSMSYSCGYWAQADTLEQAQQAKLDLICRKLELKPGEHLLEIGCGWGGLARHAAIHHGVRVTGVTVSREQRNLALERCQGLPIDIELMDYRAIQGRYDKVVSVGMFEHVGRKNYPVYFDTVRRVLKEDGLFLLHTIGSYRTTRQVDPWIDRYIFPNGKLPSALELTDSLEDRFLIEDWHNFGPDYDRTLMAWWANFEAAWPHLSRAYDARFYRMWKYYLHACAGFFRARQGQLWQLVLSKRQRPGPYRSLR